MTKNNNHPNDDNRIDAALNEVGESLRETIRRAVHEAEKAQARLDEMARVFADSKRAPAPVPPKFLPMPAAKPSMKVYYPDSLFLNALTRDWQSARQLHNKLRASGVSKGSIYARFQRLADDPTSVVEGSDYSYRLKAAATPVTAPTTRSAPTMRKARKAASGSPRKAPRMVRLTRPDDAIEDTREFWSKGVRITLTIG